MDRRLVLILGLGFAPLGCSDEPAAEIAVAVSGDRVAWVGSSDALEVVLERVTPLYQQDERGLSEAQMLREQFLLEPEEQLFRLHLIGSAETVADAGTVRLGAGELRSFSDAPAELAAPQRLLWQSVLQGLPVPETEQRVRRSMVVHGRGFGDQVLDETAASWSNDQRSLPLRREVWNEGARRAFFDAAVEPRSEPPAIDE